MKAGKPPSKIKNHVTLQCRPESTSRRSGPTAHQEQIVCALFKAHVYIRVAIGNVEITRHIVNASKFERALNCTALPQVTSACHITLKLLAASSVSISTTLFSLNPTTNSSRTKQAVLDRVRSVVRHYQLDDEKMIPRNLISCIIIRAKNAGSHLQGQSQKCIQE